MERRELEDNEPLSSRRNRLRGISPGRARDLSPVKQVPPEIYLESHLDASRLPKGDEADDQGETVAQRNRRLKDRETLNTAIGDVGKAGSRPVSRAFTDEVLSQVGALDVHDKLAAEAEAPQVPEGEGEDVREETLGQRRKRLQAEALAANSNPESRDVTNGDRPGPKPGAPMAQLLSRNPIGPRQPSREHIAAPAAGTLLHANEQSQAKQRQQLLATNRRSSSYGNVPGGDTLRRASQANLVAGMLGAGERERDGGASPGAFQSGVHYTGAGNVMQMPTNANAPTPAGYFGAAPMPMGYAGVHAGPGTGAGAGAGANGIMFFPPPPLLPPQLAQQHYFAQQGQMVNPMAYQGVGMGGYATQGMGKLGGQGYGVPGMGQG
ncbi:hypothetical protein LTR28_001155, partial [Elasticomyces elasticus]